MLYPTDYEKAIHYFLEEFAGDEQFINVSRADAQPHLTAVLERVAAAALQKQAKFDAIKIFLLDGQGFYHGNAIIAGRVLLFFYFQESDTGVAALVPGISGAMEVARFHLTAGLADPRKN